MTNKILIKPYKKLLLFKPQGGEEVTKSGVYLHKDAKSDRTESIGVRAELVEVGENYTGPLANKIGQKVVLAKWDVYKVTILGSEYIIAKDKDVLALLDDNAW